MFGTRLFVRLSLSPSFPPKYQFEPTLTGDVTRHPQLWARVVAPRTTRFWCCQWEREGGSAGDCRMPWAT